MNCPDDEIRFFVQRVALRMEWTFGLTAATHGRLCLLVRLLPAEAERKYGDALERHDVPDLRLPDPPVSVFRPS